VQFCFGIGLVILVYMFYFDAFLDLGIAPDIENGKYSDSETNATFDFTFNVTGCPGKPVSGSVIRYLGPLPPTIPK